jgi:hypothetical protein
LQGVTKETLDLVLQAIEDLPNLERINGIEVAKATASVLAPGQILTRAEHKAEMEAKQAEKDLSAWAKDIKEAAWATGGNANRIAGPIWVETDEASSTANGVRGKDWNGIPAAKLCKTKDECGSVVVIGFRKGAASGNYVPVDGTTGSGFTGNKGETTVLVYDVASSTVRPIAVVATTEPPDRVSSQAAAVGPIDLDAAYAWVASHTN